MKLSKTILRLVATFVFLFQFSITNSFSLGTAGFGDTISDSDKPTGSFVLGATSIDGVNYQQVGFRADIPIGKLGIGLDVQLLLDEEGNVREEDWDDSEDYFNLIYYIRWDRKGAPFYTKVGGLDSSYIGYSNIVNGYSNMIEYPDYKRIGMEMEVNTENFRAELLINDYKELTAEEPSMFIASRLAYKVGGKLEIGLTVASDLNEYNGFRDTDDDGYPDEIDFYPDDDQYVTEYDMLYDKLYNYYLNSGDPVPETSAQDDLSAFIAIDELNSTTRADLSPFDFSDQTSDLTIVGLDIGYPIIDGDFIKMDIYSTYADIIDYGWGISAPGFRTRFGDFLTFIAEYRIQSKEFLYGYFNNTYELERARFIIPDNGDPTTVETKQDDLLGITDSMKGYLVGASINLQNFVNLSATYLDMEGDDNENKSLTGSAILNNGALPNFPKAKGYYVQNNVEDLDEWKTPSTVTGVIIQYTMGVTTFAFDHQYTFADINGDGEIEGDEETIKTLSVTASVSF